MEMKVVLQVFCVLIIAALIILFLLPNFFNIRRSFGPVLYEVIEEIRCRFEKGLCFSLYPNPAVENSLVGVTMRTQEWYVDQQACIYDVRSGAVMTGRCCRIQGMGKGSFRCMSNFTAPDLGGGPPDSFVYYAFLDTDEAQDLDVGEPRSSEIMLRVNPE